MARIVLHIGTHKTATTSLQNVFWHNAELLAQKSLIYPHLPYSRSDTTGHHGLVFFWEHMPRPFQLEGGSRTALEKIAAEYVDRDVTVFLSSEEFSRIPAREGAGISEIREIFADYESIEVICTLRTQWQYLQSIYLEMSKSAQPGRPPHFVDPVIKSGKLGGLMVDYNLLLTHLQQSFEPEEITFFDFDTCRQSESGIIGCFLEHLGLDLKPDDLTGPSVSNVSPMALAGWVGNILCAPKASTAELVDLAEIALEREFGEDIRTCLFTKDEFSRLAEHFNERNAELAARRAPFQPGFSVTPADPRSITHFRNDVGGNFWIRMSRVLAAEMI